MKKIGILFMILALVLSTVAFAEEGEVKTVVCVGDSITFGAGITERGHTYPGQLQELLGEGYKVVNAAENGRTLQREGMLNEPGAKMNVNMTYWDSRVINNAIDAKPDVVLIMLGTNDAKWFNWNAENYASQYLELVSTFQQLESHPDVYVMIPPPVYPEKDKDPGIASIQEDVIDGELGDCVRSVAENSGCGLIDVYTPLLEHAELFKDGVHPIREGNQVIATTVFESVNW